MVRQWGRSSSTIRLPHTQAAIAFADRVHAEQFRGDGTPFIRHPLEVASLLHQSAAPDHVIAAGVLHDVIEKTHATARELKERFGPAITRLVLAVSDDEQIAGYSDRKAALRQQVATAGDEALAIFAADKVSKVREWRREAAAGGEPDRATVSMIGLRARRLKHYRRSLAMLEERLPDSPLVQKLAAELNALLDDRDASLLI